MKNRSHLASFLLALVLLCAAVPAWAAGGGGEAGLFSGDIGNVFWTVLIFVLVLFVLGKFAWGPILERLQEREEFIHDSLAKADEARKAAEVQLQHYEQKLAEARAEATAIVEEGRRDAEVVKEKIETDAKAEAETMLARAKREIGIAKETAIKELYGTAGQLAVGVAGKIINQELTAADHERLIADSIAELEARSQAHN